MRRVQESESDTLMNSALHPFREHVQELDGDGLKLSIRSLQNRVGRTQMVLDHTWKVNFTCDDQMRNLEIDFTASEVNIMQEFGVSPMQAFIAPLISAIDQREAPQSSAETALLI